MTNQEIIKRLKNIYSHSFFPCCKEDMNLFMSILGNINALINDLEPNKPKYRINDIVISKSGAIYKIIAISRFSEHEQQYEYELIYLSDKADGGFLYENRLYTFEEYVKERT